MTVRDEKPEIQPNKSRKQLSISAIARRTDLDRKTVRKYLKRGLTAPSYGPRSPRPQLLDPYRTYLRQRVKAYPKMRATRLLREIRDWGYPGGYSQLTAHDSGKTPVSEAVPKRDAKSGIPRINRCFFWVLSR